MKKIYALGFALAFTAGSHSLLAQDKNVGIGTTSPDQSAVLDIQSSNKGLLIPRMTLDQRNDIIKPVDGLLIYQTNDKSGFYFYEKNSWKPISATEAKSVAGVDGDWTLIGNAGTSPANNFLGTTDAQPLVMKTNGSERLRIGETGNVGIGTANPQTALHVDGVGRFTGRNAFSIGADGGQKRIQAYPTGTGQSFRFFSEINTYEGIGVRSISVGNAYTDTQTAPMDGMIVQGNVGIGSTNPTSKLYINGGNVKVNTTTGYLAVGDFEGGTPLTTPAGYRMIVQDGILTEKIKVALKTTGDWADYVFEPSYKLMSLEAVEAFTKENKHLPNVPSADDMASNGLDVAQTSKMFMEKIEELTLYMIDLNKEVKSLKAENELLKAKLK